MGYFAYHNAIPTGFSPYNAYKLVIFITNNFLPIHKIEGVLKVIKIEINKMILKSKIFSIFIILLIVIYGINKYIECLKAKEVVEKTVNHKGLDSCRLMYVMYACDCPDWVDYKKYIEHKADSRLNKPQFDTYFNDTYYIERNGAKDLPDFKLGVVIDFFGKLDTSKRLSKEDFYMDPEPIKGKIFMFSDYIIVKEYLTND